MHATIILDEKFSSSVEKRERGRSTYLQMTREDRRTVPVNNAETIVEKNWVHENNNGGTSSEKREERR